MALNIDLLCFLLCTYICQRLVHECMWDRIKCSRVINVCNHTLFCLLSFLMCLFHRFLCSFVGFCFLNSFALSSNSFFVSFDITLPFFCTHFFSDTMFLLFCTLYTHFVNLLYYLCPQILDGRSIVCVIHDGSNNSLSLLLRFLLTYQSVIFGDYICSINHPGKIVSRSGNSTRCVLRHNSRSVTPWFFKNSWQDHNHKKLENFDFSLIFLLWDPLEGSVYVYTSEV